MNVSQSNRSQVFDRPEKPSKPIPGSANKTRAQFADLDSPLQTILFVDTKADVQKARRLLFETLGFSVLTVDCGNKALSLLRLKPIDAVVVDYPVDGTDGEEIIRKIRKAKGNIPIVLLSNGPETPQSLLRMIDASVDRLAGPMGLLDALAEQLALSKSVLRLSNTAGPDVVLNLSRDPDARTWRAKNLNEAGCYTISTASLEEAVALVKRIRCSVAVVCHSFSESEQETARTRLSDASPSTPIILLRCARKDDQAAMVKNHMPQPVQ